LRRQLLLTEHDVMPRTKGGMCEARGS
jgi:hypothetical protein